MKKKIKQKMIYIQYYKCKEKNQNKCVFSNNYPSIYSAKLQQQPIVTKFLQNLQNKTKKYFNKNEMTKKQNNLHNACPCFFTHIY